MPNEYNNGQIVLRDTNGIQMSLPRFFQLALDDGNGHVAQPSQGPSSAFNPDHRAWDMESFQLVGVIPVRTPTYGTVIAASDGYNGGMGTHAIIEDDLGKQHRFMHMAEGSLAISAGDSVEQGTLLGYIGNTGDSTGPHLHYDVLENGSKISDPILAYDSATLPSGWNMNDAAAVENWDYIPLDDAATDYGPPGGVTPSEPFFPTTPCYDISWAQVEAGSLDTCINAIALSESGGIILQVGAIRNTGFEAATAFSPAAAVSRILESNLGLGIYFYNYADYTQDMTSAFEDALDFLQSIGATKEKVNLGVWIDTEIGSEWDPTPSSDTSVNYAYVERFMNDFDAAEYPVAGVYSSAGTFSIYPAASIGDKPIWAAYVPFTFEEASRSTLEQYLPEAVYTKVYIFQHSWTGRVAGWSGDLDSDKVLMPMPTAGGGGGGGTTEVIKVTVDIIPPKRIYFNPNPGVITPVSERLDERQQTIQITTDATPADLYYTTDGSSPYQYNLVDGAVVYALAANALQYSNSISIYKDTHVRVVAVPEGTQPGDTFTDLLAKASGTYLFAYQSAAETWEFEKIAYATEDGDVSFFEENRQAFLRLHDQLTEEEVLYAPVYKHDYQTAEEDAQDDASTTGVTEPTEDPTIPEV